MKTSSTNKKIRDIINMVKEGKLLHRPEFQRRLVWTRDDKNRFLDSILRGFPFPEIYFADGEIDTTTGQGTQLLVDGLQRVSTITQYFNSDSELSLTTIKPYKELTEDEKRGFLQYDVSVRDLGAISRDQVIEVFQRINATKYSLADIEINNAIYVGALKKFAESIADHEFFKDHSVFNSQDYKRMGDLRFGLLVVGTIMMGYFNRDDAFEELLDRYNDDFPQAEQLRDRIEKAIGFIDECGFVPKSRLWRKADLFSMIVEIDNCLSQIGRKLAPSFVVDTVSSFFDKVGEGIDQGTVAGIYYKAALQASNDRGNRLRRGNILLGLLTKQKEADILKKLKADGLA